MFEICESEAKARGLVLFSGGLDSLLAVLVLRNAGAYVEAVTFASPFFHIDAAKKGALQIGVKLNIVDFTDEITSLVEHPKHGFGGALNPCIDCHAAMIRKASEMVKERGYDFVATGEVLNQRPMSQNRRSLGIVEEESGAGTLLLRPLSAKLLEPSQVELDGKIDREKLYAIDGRNRQVQQELARNFGLTEYPSPAGGCLLTEKLFCNKLKDLKERKMLHDKVALEVLKLGRHFKFPDGARFVIGRNAHENMRLQALAPHNFELMRPVTIPGPSCLLQTGATEADIKRAKELCAAYSDSKGAPLLVRHFGIDATHISEEMITPMPRESAKEWML